MNVEIQPADVRLRRVSAVVLLLALLAAVATVLLARDWMIARAVASTPTQLVAQMRQWIGIAAIAAGACLLLLAIHAWRLSRATRAQQRWPLIEARVLRDTPVRHGEAALRIGRMLHVVSLLLFGFAAAIVAIGWRLFAVAS
jgi:hypothetical protein